MADQTTKQKFQGFVPDESGVYRGCPRCRAVGTAIDFVEVANDAANGDANVRCSRCGRLVAPVALARVDPPNQGRLF